MSDNKNPLIDIISNQFLTTIEECDDVDDRKKDPSMEEIFLALVFCKTLADFCNSTIQVLRKIQPKATYPNIMTINMCEQTLRSLYCDDFFIEEEDLLIPNWKILDKVISNDKKYKNIFKFYNIVKKNIYNNPKIREAINKDDKKYLVGQLDLLFGNVSFKDEIIKCKNLILSGDINKSDYQDLMEYINGIIENLFNYDEHIRELEEDRKNRLVS